MKVNVKFWDKEETSNKFGNKINFIDYPEHDNFFELKENTGYDYVSASYLNGLVNYVTPIYLICSQKYSNDEEFDKIIEYLKNIDMEAWPCEWYHTDLSKIEDNVYYLGKTESSYVIFCYDRDCSDCMILRLSKKDFTLNDAKEIMLDQAKYESNSYANNDENEFSRYIELPSPTGWIKG